MLSFLNFIGAEATLDSEPRASGGSANAGSNGNAGAPAVEAQLAAALREAAGGDDGDLKARLEDLRPRLEELLDQRPAGEPGLSDHGSVGGAVAAYLQRDGFGAGEDPVCQWMYEWYQSKNPERQRFVAMFLPQMATVFLMQRQRTPRLLGIQAVMIAVYEAEVQSRPPPAAVPRRGVGAPGAGPRTDAPCSAPPGVAALLAGAGPTSALTTLLMPATIEGNIRAWQCAEAAASAISEFCSRMATYRAGALEAACVCCLALASYSCPWVLELAAELGGSECLGEGFVVPPGLQALGEVEPETPLEGARPRAAIEGRLVEQLCRLLGHCWHRAAGTAGLAAGGPCPDTQAALSSLGRTARAAALALHARVLADSPDSPDLVCTSALLRGLKPEASRLASSSPCSGKQ